MVTRSLSAASNVSVVEKKRQRHYGQAVNQQQLAQRAGHNRRDASADQANTHDGTDGTVKMPPSAMAVSAKLKPVHSNKPGGGSTVSTDQMSCPAVKPARQSRARKRDLQQDPEKQDGADQGMGRKERRSHCREEMIDPARNHDRRRLRWQIVRH